MNHASPVLDGARIAFSTPKFQFIMETPIQALIFVEVYSERALIGENLSTQARSYY